MKIYTKTGDKGQTGLVGGSRVSKDSARIHAIGDVDELNACIGLARLVPAEENVDDLLRRIQNWLFDLGAELATPPDSKYVNQSIGETQTKMLEESIDAQTEQLPPLRAFILPGGTEAAARLHHCRSVCRRAERSMLALHARDPLRPETLVFVNRLSDWLFLAARTANRAACVEDVKWNSPEEN